MLNQIINGKRYIYDLVLCKSNREPICFIPYNKDFSITCNWHETKNSNSISFSINKYIKSHSAKQLNPAWEKISKSLLIHLYIREYHPTTNFSEQVIYEELFYINSANYSASEQTKLVEAESWHKVHFENIKLRGYEQTRKLYDYETLAGYDEPQPIRYDVNDSLKGGILNYIIEYKLPDWTVKYDYRNFNIEYSDNDKASINYVKNLIEEYIWNSDESGENVSPYGLLSTWSTWVNNLGQLFGMQLVERYGELVIPESSTFNKLQDKSPYPYIRTLLQYRAELVTNNVLAADEIGSGMSGNSLINKEFGKDWLPSESMPANSSDEYNINILTIIYKTMFYRILNKYKNVLSLLVNRSFNIPEKITYESEEGTETGYICLVPCKLVSSIDAENRIGLEDLYNLTFRLYRETAKVYDAICNLSVDTKEVYRNLSFSNDDLYSVFTQLEDSYICFFKFDNINKIIYVYSRENEIFNVSSNLIISPYNYMSGYDYSAKSDKVVTRLYFTGKDNLTFAGVNPTGQRFVDDFSPFINEDIYMSKELKSYLLWYDSLVNEYISKVYTTSVNGNTTTKSVTGILNDYINTAENLLRIAISYFTSFYCFASDENEDFTNEDKYLYRLLSFKNQMIVSFQSLYDYIENCNNEYKRSETADLLDLSAMVKNNLNKNSFSDYISMMINAGLNDNIEYARTVLKFFGVNIDDNSSFNNLIEKNSYTYYNNNTTVIPAIKSFKLEIAKSLVYDNNVMSYVKERHNNLSDKDKKILADNLLSEYRNFIFEDDINANYIYDADVAYKYTRDYFKYLHTIPYEISIESADILSNSNYQKDWDNICALGTYIIIQSPETEEYQKVRLLSYTHSPANNQLSLTFGNSEELIDNLNNVTKKVWQYSMKLAEKSQNYISQYDSIIKEAAEKLNIDLPSINYDFGLDLDQSSAINENIYNNGTTIVPPNTSNPNGKTSGLDSAYEQQIGTYEGQIKAAQKTANDAKATAETAKATADNVKATLDNLPEIGATIVNENVIKSDTMQTTWCFSRYMLVQFMETNFDALDSNKPYKQLRKYIRIFDDNIKVIEAELSETEGEFYKDPNGKKLYWTAVTGENAYKFFTYTSPLTISKDKRPEGMSDTDFENLYSVVVRKTTAEYVKCSLGFPLNSSGTGEPELVFGTGDENGNGKYYFVKDADSGRFVYKSRTDGLEYGVAIKDDAPYLVTAGQLTQMYPIAVRADISDISDLPVGTIIFQGAVT